MPFDNTGGEPLKEPEGEIWAAVGYRGVVLQVERFPDGTAGFSTFHKDDETSKVYGMRLSPEASMDLLGFLMGKPQGKAN